MDGHKVQADSDLGNYPNDGTFIMDGFVISEQNPIPDLIEYNKFIEPIQVRINRKKL